jgi:hypothetical protein
MTRSEANSVAHSAECTIKAARESLGWKAWALLHFVRGCRLLFLRGEMDVPTYRRCMWTARRAMLLKRVEETSIVRGLQRDALTVLKRLAANRGVMAHATFYAKAWPLYEVLFWTRLPGTFPRVAESYSSAVIASAKLNTRTGR